MNQQKQYFTLSSMCEYLSSRAREGGTPLDFREALIHMRDEGRLTTDGTPRQWPSPDMDPRTFERVYADFPICCDSVLEVSEEDFLSLLPLESTMVPPGQDVYCRWLLPQVVRPMMKMEYFEMYYVMRGNARLNFEDDSFPLGEGDLCILPPKTLHSMITDEQSFVMDIILRSSTLDSRFGELMTMSGVFSGFFREALYGTAQPNLLILHTKPGDEAINLCLRGLISELCSLDKHSWSTTICWVKLLLSNALRSCGEKVEISRFPTGGNPRADCGEILQYIQQNYRTVRLSTLASQFHYNETYLSRMLQNYAHQSFTEIVRDIRMNRAVEYLINSSLRVHEIAGLVGYSSVDHFSRAFKTTYGVSPQGYRREKRKQ